MKTEVYHCDVCGKQIARDDLLFIRIMPYRDFEYETYAQSTMDICPACAQAGGLQIPPSR